MMKLFNYAPFWRGEGTKRASLCTRWSVEEARGDEICKASILTGDHGVVSARNIGDDEEKLTSKIVGER